MVFKNIRLTERFPSLQENRVVKIYERALYQAQMDWDPATWIVMSVLLSVLIGLLIFLLIGLHLFIPGWPINIPVMVGMAGKLFLFEYKIAILFFVLILDIFLAWPFYKASRRIDAIEDTLPEALKQMADTLKAGGTYEYALREIASTEEYGPLTDELEITLRQIEDGASFSNALEAMGDRVDSKLMKRTITIINDSIRAGAGLADVLDEVADDIRSMHRIGRERKSRTMMQVLFMVAAGAMVAPFIFGVVASIALFLIETAVKSGASCTQLVIPIGSNGLPLYTTEQACQIISDISNATKDKLVILMELYLIVQLIASAIMMSFMRDGKPNRALLYGPILIFIGYIVFTVSHIVIYTIIGGIR